MDFIGLLRTLEAMTRPPRMGHDLDVEDGAAQLAEREAETECLVPEDFNAVCRCAACVAEERAAEDELAAEEEVSADPRECPHCCHLWERHDFLGCHDEGCICGEDPADQLDEAYIQPCWQCGQDIDLIADDGICPHCGESNRGVATTLGAAQLSEREAEEERHVASDGGKWVFNHTSGQASGMPSATQAHPRLCLCGTCAPHLHAGIVGDIEPPLTPDELVRVRGLIHVPTIDRPWEPELNSSERVALRQLIEERFGDQSSASNPAGTGAEPALGEEPEESLTASLAHPPGYYTLMTDTFASNLYRFPDRPTAGDEHTASDGGKWIYELLGTKGVWDATNYPSPTIVQSAPPPSVDGEGPSEVSDIPASPSEGRPTSELLLDAAHFLGFVPQITRDQYDIPSLMHELRDRAATFKAIEE